MRLTFIVIYLGFIVSARKHRPKFSSSSEESFATRMPQVSGNLNLEGKIRRKFAVEAALEDHATNMICSPLSVMMPLGKLAMGAGKRTEKELFKALHLSSRKELNPTFKELITSLEYLPGVTLDMANRIYISTRNSINETFASSTKLVFKSTVEKISAKNPQKAAHTINEWVAERTRNKIKNLINPWDITEDTSLILVNAIYFAGKWLNKFDKTFTDDFFSPAGTHKIPMMSRKGIYNYWKCDTLNAEIIEIPYEGSQSAMIVVLPYSNTGLEVLLRALKIAPDLLNSALAKMRVTNVILTMPKFKIESEIDLKDLFIKLGMRTIFDFKRSDLNGLIVDETVFVTKAIQKAVIEVNELGTEASAATGILTSIKAASLNVPIFLANRPFFFHIVCHREQLFSGVFSGYSTSEHTWNNKFGGIFNESLFYEAVIGLGSSMYPTKIIPVVVNHPFYFIVRGYQEQLFAGIFNGS